MKTVPFPGEAPIVTVINCGALDIVEEQEFLKYCKQRNIDINSLESLEKAFDDWEPERFNII
jgi:hypothetical protein